MSLSLRQLRYFLAVAEHGQFTRAAEAALVSQPALSQQIQRLERAVGATLFDRMGRRVELTVAGEVLRDHARRIVREVENAKAAVDDVRGAVRGELTVASVQSANVGFLVGVLARFRAEHGGVVVRVREDRADDVEHAVREADANLGLTYLPVGRGEALEVRPLYEEELVLVVPAGDGRAGTAVAPGELSGVPLILPPPGYCLRRSVETLFEAAGARPRVTAEITAVEGICEAVRAGLGSAVLPARYVLPRAERLRVGVARIDGVSPRAIGVIRRRDRHLCAATRAFVGALEEAAVDGPAVAAAPAGPTRTPAG